MKNKMIVLLVLVVLSAMALVACGGQPTAGDQGSDQVAVPADYKGKTNPFAGNANAIATGQNIYNTYCVSCHGNTGKGDGPGAAALNPKVADLMDIPEGDDFIYWRVAEGGAFAPFNSAMPAWKAVLTADQIWQVTAYIRSLAK